MSGAVCLSANPPLFGSARTRCWFANDSGRDLSVEWLDTLLVDAPRALAKCYSIVMETLDRNHGKMLSMFKASVL